MRRTDYAPWEEFFMNVAILAAKRSKDPVTQVGSCIVNCENKIISTGYNGFPVFKDKNADEVLPWTKKDNDFYKTKYPYVIHAEVNGILNATCNLKNCTMYVTWYPCHECAKIIIQSGISKVVYLNKHSEVEYRDSLTASEYMFSLAKVDCVKYIDRIL